MSENRQKIQAALSGVAGRLSRRRAMESAAVGAVAAGLAAAAIEPAWMIAAVYRLWAAGICLAPAVLGPACVAIPAARRRLGLARGQALLAAALCALIGAGGLWAVLGGWHAAVPRLLLLALLPAGALAGAAAELVRRASLHDAAVLIDTRCGLAERLATAEELARSPQADAPAARCVYGQALAALGGLRPGELPLWRRGRATAGALALVGLLCLTLSALPTWGLADRIAGALGKMTPQARQELARSLQEAARKAANQPELAEDYRRAADAVVEVDPATLQEIIRKLQERGIPVARVVGRRAMEAIAAAEAAGGAAPNESAGPGKAAPPEPRENIITTQPVAHRQDGSPVYVYDKDYAKALAARAAKAAPASGGEAATPSFVRLDEAWRHARDRAEASLAAGKVPAPYRSLVRDFFAFTE